MKLPSQLCTLFRHFLLVVVLAGQIVSGQGAQTQKIPFVLPWNDSSPSVTDFSALNSSIGSERVAVNAEGHFTVGGERVRFLGVNFAADSPFMPTNNADAVAARLAKYGVNNVRFHHMDAAWAYNGGLLSYSSSSSTNFRSGQLERLHFLISRLKAHGIYCNINLLVGREYRAGDGLGPEVVGMDWKDTHILGYFYEPSMVLQKDFARKLLAPTNRFTGLTLAQDPAVSFVEIINENGIIQKWLDGGLDRLPVRYAAVLSARWNEWLAVRYTNDVALLSAWKIVDQPLGTNLLRNGAFSNSLTSWNGEQRGNAKATFARTPDFNGQPSARITVATPDSVSWHVQFNQAGLRLDSNQVYTISWWAKSSPATNADASVMRAHTDYVGLGYQQTMNLTTQWQQFTGTFQPGATESNARVNFGGMGNKAAAFWFADVRLSEGGKLGTIPEGGNLASRTIPNVRYSGTGFVATREARQDWLRFLRELEQEYYDEMVRYIRSELGYAGLIFGTIMANSPASVQSRLDVIDGHAYWQHPDFPGQPWDSINWLVRNQSMVNTLDGDNTLSGLARQRIKGKPFTVTEYQHSSPNYYGAEGPLLLAAYGGLQDWDGLWLFDYGHGNDTVGMGYVRGFFEIGQHPTKMANLLLAASLFRRGDVRPAHQVYSMKLTPDRELELLQNTWAWGVFSSSQLGVPGKLAFTSRLSTDVGVNASGLTSPPPTPSDNVLASDTGELKWDLSQPGKGLVTIDTSRTKALIGHADNETVALGPITFRPGTTELGWCTMGLTLVRGESLTNNATLLLLATGWWENTGQVWKNTAKDSVGNQWGRAPVLTEVVPFTISLPVGTNQVRVWSLNTRGERMSPLPVTGTATVTDVIAGTNAGTIWYEIEIGVRWAAGFEDWRKRYFDSQELDNPNVSSPGATPNGDSIPNLVKYYLGLPGNTPASRSHLPRAELRVNGDEHYFALSFLRNRSAADLFGILEASSDLHSWASACCMEERVVDIDQTLQEVTFKDLMPVSASSQRFLRLKVKMP